MLSIVDNSKNIKKIEFPNNVKYELRDSLDAIIRGRNKKPKKKQTKQTKQWIYLKMFHLLLSLVFFLLSKF